MIKLLVLFCLVIIYFCIKDDKEIEHKNTKKIKEHNYVDNKKIAYAGEDLHYEQIISDFLEHIDEYDGD